MPPEARGAAVALFVSDVHLKPDARAHTDAWLDFLAAWRGRSEALYVLGDLFDLWVGDDADLEAYGGIADALAELTRAGTAVHLMHGNHDFLLGEAFYARAGARPLSDPSVLEVGGKRLLLTHGDALCTDDTEYQAFRARIRAPAAVEHLLGLPVAERRRLGAEIRAASRVETARKSAKVMDVNRDAALAVLRAHDADCLLHGHTHRPGVQVLDDAGRRRITLGAWHEGPSVLWWDGAAWQATGIAGV